MKAPVNISTFEKNVNSFLSYITQPKAQMLFLLLLMTVVEIRRGYFKGFKAYLKTLRPQPYLLILALSFAVVLCVNFGDQAVLRAVQTVPEPGFFKDVFIDLGAYLGKFNGLWLILGVFYVLSLLIRQSRFQLVIFSALLSSALAGGLAHIFKHLFQRARPYTGNGPYHFFDVQGLLENTRQYQSFPSGDVAIVAGASAYFFFALKGRAWRYGILIFPFLTALSRVWNNKHWPSDTLFGIGVGFAAGYFVYQFRLFLEPKKPSES